MVNAAFLPFAFRIPDGVHTRALTSRPYGDWLNRKYFILKKKGAMKVCTENGTGLTSELTEKQGCFKEIRVQTQVRFLFVFMDV